MREFVRHLNWSEPKLACTNMREAMFVCLHVSDWPACAYYFFSCVALNTHAHYHAQSKYRPTQLTLLLMKNVILA